MLLCVPKQAHRCGEWLWAASKCLLLFKLPTLHRPHRAVEQLCRETVLPRRTSHPTSTDSTQAAKILHGFSIQSLFRSKFGKLCWLSLLEGLLKICSKSPPGPSLSLSLCSYSVSTYLKIVGFHESHFFLIYLTDYAHSFTDTFIEQDVEREQNRVVFWQRTRFP